LYPPHVTTETNFFKITEIYLRGWTLWINNFSYALAGDRTKDLMFKGFKYVSLISHYVGHSFYVLKSSKIEIHISLQRYVDKGRKN
jgi:hypothetical protein